ncbi:MAG: glycosyltransferase involved in cell wall biosynthesis [Bacteriovoracaceae bacterium]
MKVLANTYPIAFDCPGGGEIQLIKTIEYLNLKKEITVEKYNQWSPQFDNFDIVHYFSVHGGSFPFCNYTNKKSKPLIISSVLWPNNPKQYDMNEIKRTLDCADLIFPNSKLESNLLSKVFEIPPNKFHVTYNGIDPLFLNDSTTTPNLFRDTFNIHEPFILCVANIEHRKNQLNLARALRNFDKKVVLIGNIRVQSYYQDIISESNGNFQYVGSIDHESELLRSAYRACSLFVLPSHLETPGLAALEAAAMGCKIAITKEGSTVEYFKDYVTYLDPTDNSQMRSAIELELSKPIDNQLSEHVKLNFTWNNTATQCLAGYEKVL